MNERENVRQITDYIANQQHKQTQKELKRARNECNIIYAAFMVSLMINVILFFEIIR